MGVFSNPPDISKAGFLSLLERAMARLSDRPPWLGGSQSFSSARGEPMETVHPFPRLLVTMEGSDRHAISIRGERANVELAPGHSLYLASNAWTIHFLDAPCEMLGIVFRPQFVRLIQIIVNDQPNPPRNIGTPWIYHLASPLHEAGVHVCGALDCLAEQGNNASPARELLFSLLKLVHEQLAEDEPTRQSHPQAYHTWQAIETYLAAHFGRQVSRESVAAEFGLHPNYLSALARQSTGQPFRRVLENVRMLNARRLLRDTDMKLARIATLCGYGGANRLSTVFHRATGITPTSFRRDSARLHLSDRHGPDAADTMPSGPVNFPAG